MDTVPKVDRSQVLGSSVFAAGESLGLSRQLVGKIIGRDRTSIDRAGIDPQSKSGELAIFVIRIYRSLYALMGGDVDNMRHFMRTSNRGTGGVPLEQMSNIQGLLRVCAYLDAMRAKG
ncbi:MAG: MbcA/ParS/Xre antitoxin family protein [Congregibacter sp.]|nr:MbcA/ParS/Xre antitoxin family protein [Congregibacter sp.]MDP5070779.1 MbcA/ParS/Xre antitoxin family protein [Congregibacter sp.]